MFNELKKTIVNVNRMKFIIVMMLSVSILPLFAQQTIPLSLQVSPQKVTVFGEGHISTVINERDFALSPDGRELHYTIPYPHQNQLFRQL